MNDKYDVTIFKLIPEIVGKDRQHSIKNILTEKAYEALEKFNIFNDLIISKYVVENYILLYGHLKTDGPGWVENINKNFLNSSGVLTRTNKFQEFAVFIFSGEEYKSSWCVSLGYGYRILNRDCIVKEFGKNYVAKVGDPNEVRMLKSASTIGKRRVDASHIPSGEATLHDYPYDQLSDVAKSIRSKCGESVATGSDGLKVRIDISNLYKIKKYLKNIEKNFKNKNSMIKGLDYIKSIENEDLKNELKEDLMSKISKNQYISLDLSIPVDLLNENIEIGKFQIDGFEKEMSEYNFYRLRNFINKNSRITFCWDNLQQKREFDIIDCLYAYLEYKGDYYRLFHGKWYLTDKGYIDKMREIINEKIYKSHSTYDTEYNAMVRALHKCSKGFHESEYNKNLYENLKGGYFGDLSRGKALLDMSGLGHKKFMTSKGYSVEVCDVYKESGIYIHVKKYLSGNSSIEFDHLCYQTVNSARIFYNSGDSLRKLKEEIIDKMCEDRKKYLKTTSSRKYYPKIICFVIIVEEKDNKKDNEENKKISDYLSDFSCISLYNSIRQIENMGLEARAFIVEYKKDSEESGITCSSQISE